MSMPWSLPDDIPWHVWTSPLDKWATQPSFVVGEYLFIACALVALIHAVRTSRAHVLCWICAIVAGTANDMIFMALPLVDNFWQAQATIMITPRLPLYIPCVYVCFIYLPTVSVWQVGLRPLPRATLSGLAAILFYAPYDIIGAKFLWWTWHDSDLPISNRLLGVPIGSTIWVITFVATFAWLLGRVIDEDPEVGRRTAAKGLALVAGLTTIVMVLQMTVIQQLDGGIPGPIGLLVVVVLYGGVALRGRSQAELQPTRPNDRLIWGAIAAYFVTLTIIVASFDPATHRSASLHQTYGRCHVEAKDIAGFTRFEFLCAEDFDEDFSFDCTPSLPAHGDGWYTVCGKPFTNRAAWIGAVAGLGLTGALLYAMLLGLGPFRRETTVGTPA